MTHKTHLLCLATAASLTWSTPARAQEFMYWFTDDFESYGNMSNFVRDNNNGWYGGWNSMDPDFYDPWSAGDPDLRRFGSGQDTWKIVNGQLRPKTDTHCEQEYNKNDCAFGFDTYVGAPGAADGTEGREPIDNWIVRETAESRADPDFGMLFQFSNSDDDSIGMVFRLQDPDNYYLYMWAWRKGNGNNNNGKHLWSVGCCEGGHPAAVCAENGVPKKVYPSECKSEPGFADRIVSRASGHGGWLYRIDDGVITELASTPKSYIKGQVYNVLIRGMLQYDGAGAVTGTEIKIWMDIDNNGFNDADVVLTYFDPVPDAIVTGGAYGIWQYDNGAFTVDGFIAQEAPIPPTIDPSSISVTADDLNGFLHFEAASNRNAIWTMTILDPGTNGTCEQTDQVVMTYESEPWVRDLDEYVPGLTPGADYCWKLEARNSLGTDPIWGADPVTLAPRLSVTPPAINPTGVDEVDFSFTSNDVGTGEVNYVMGDCAAGGYALRTGVGGANTYAKVLDHDDLRLGVEQTVEAWVYPEAASGGWSRVVGKGVDASLGTNYGLWIHDTGTVAYRVADGASVCNAVSPAGAVGMASWHHLGGRYDGATLEVLVDGTVVGSSACTLIPTQNAAPVTVGSDIAGPAFRGLVAHVGVHASRLDLTDHVALGPVFEAGPDVSTRLLLHFRETTNQQVIWDGSGNDHHGFIGERTIVDAADPARFPTSLSLSEAGGSGTQSYSGTISGLSFGQTYCSRAFVTDDDDPREAVSEIRLFEAILDTVAPVVTPGPTVQLECSGVGTLASVNAPTITDDYDPAPAVSAYLNTVAPANIIGGPPYTAAFPYDAPGPISTIVWVVSDFGGNTTTKTQTVWVDDSLAPSLEAGLDVTVEASDPGGVAGGTAVALSPTLVDGCDPAPGLSNDAPALFGLGTTLVTFVATDAAGNSATDTVSVTVQDTTPPSFDEAPGVCPASLPDLDLGITDATAGTDCYTGPLPAPAVTDNAASSAALSFFLDQGAGPATTPLSSASDSYCEGDGTVSIAWKVVDPTGNACYATQNVVVGTASFSTTYDGLIVGGVGPSLDYQGKFASQDVTMQVTVDGCTDPTVTFSPVGASSTSETGDPTVHASTYAAEAVYSAVMAQVTCAGTLTFAGPASFGIDKTAPATDFSELPIISVIPTEPATYPRVFWGEAIALSAFDGMDTLGPIQSGVSVLQVVLEKVTDPAGPTVVGELTLRDSSVYAPTSTDPLAVGPAIVGASAPSYTFACNGGAATVCPDGESSLSVYEVSVLDADLRGPHRLVFDIVDYAGNATEEVYYFYVRNWDDALDEALDRGDVLVNDPGNFFALLELEDALTNLEVADAYMTLTPAWLDGSYLRAQYGVDYYETAWAMGIDVSPQREYLARAAWGDVRLYVDQLVPNPHLPADDTYVQNASDALDVGLGLRPVGDWEQMIREARDGRDAVALLYADYQAFREAQFQAHDNLDTDVGNWPPPTSDDLIPGLGHIDEAQAMITAAREMLLDSVKPEIEAALTDPGTTQTEGLEAIIAAIDAIAAPEGCLDKLSQLDLDDLEYTLCYLDIDQMARTLNTVQISMVSTYRWQAAVALGLFGMLDMSMRLSPTGFPWIVDGAYFDADYYGPGDGAVLPNSYHDPALWSTVGDADLLDANAAYEAAVAALEAGDVLEAYEQFTTSRCLIVTLYNRYFSTAAGEGYANVSGNNGWEDYLDPSPYCP